MKMVVSLSKKLSDWYKYFKSEMGLSECYMKITSFLIIFEAAVFKK